MNVVIIQARMGSTRLPGKVLKEIKGYPLLLIQQLRLQPSKLADRFIIATTTNHEDDAIADFCRENGIVCSRGSDWDVLDRYYQAALPYKPDRVIRVTSDCPLHHHTVLDFVIAEHGKSGKDYFSNSNHEPDFLEDGFDVEVFTFTALETAWKQAKLLSEREHVTPYIKHSGLFSCGWKKYNSQYNFKLSVDSPADLSAVQAIFGKFGSVTDFGMEDVMKCLEEHPEILRINSESTINAGYRKSIENDKKIE